MKFGMKKADAYQRRCVVNPSESDADSIYD
jgi:hypothetical protein